MRAPPCTDLHGHELSLVACPLKVTGKLLVLGVQHWELKGIETSKSVIINIKLFSEDMEEA